MTGDIALITDRSFGFEFRDRVALETHSIYACIRTIVWRLLFMQFHMEKHTHSTSQLIPGTIQLDIRRFVHVEITRLLGLSERLDPVQNRGDQE
jgi:hypothetical protein